MSSRTRPASMPAPRSDLERKVARAMVGSTADATWLDGAAGLSPVLDEARLQHRRLALQLVAETDRLRQLDADLKREDAAYVVAVRAAARDARPIPPDTRSTPTERLAIRSAVVDRCWGVAGALVDAAERVIATLRSEEDAILGELRRRQEPALEKERQALEMLAEARQERWGPAVVSRWVVRSAADAQGRGPLLMTAPPASVPESAFEIADRPWHEVVRELTDAETAPAGVAA